MPMTAKEIIKLLKEFWQRQAKDLEKKQKKEENK